MTIFIVLFFVLSAVVGEGGGEGFFGFGADAEVCVSFGEENAAVFCDHIGGGDGQAPAWVAVDEGDVDEDGEIVVAVVLGDGVGEAELFGQGAAGVGEHGEWQAVLAGHEVVLPLGLRAYRNHQAFTLAELAIEVAPGFKFGDAVRAPAAAKELDDQGAEGEHVRAADEATGSVVEGELGGDGANGEDAVFNAGGEELLDGALADGKAVGLNQLACVGGDFVELVLEGGHGYVSAATQRSGYLRA